MTHTLKCVHMSSTLICSPKKLFDFVSKPENMPKWSSFVSQMYREGDNWIGVSILGPQKHEFFTNEQFGIFDIVVHEPGGYLLHVSNRIITNGEGCEYVTTYLQPPMISDSDFQEWIGLCYKEHNNLKMLLAA